MEINEDCSFKKCAHLTIVTLCLDFQDLLHKSWQPETGFSCLAQEYKVSGVQMHSSRRVGELNYSFVCLFVCLFVCICSQRYTLCYFQNFLGVLKSAGFF